MFFSSYYCVLINLSPSPLNNQLVLYNSQFVNPVRIHTLFQITVSACTKFNWSSFHFKVNAQSNKYVVSRTLLSISRVKKYFIFWSSFATNYTLNSHRMFIFIYYRPYKILTKQDVYLWSISTFPICWFISIRLINSLNFFISQFKIINRKIFL